jgi:uncharacterized membrane protein YqiK
MNNTLQALLPYWWVLVLLLGVVFYKFTLRVFFGMIIIPENKIGLVIKKFVLFGNKSLPDGRIIASDGEAGYQIDPLAPGLHWGYWVWQFNVDFQDFITIPKGKIGLIAAKDGSELPTGQILAREVQCNNFMDARAFFTNGGQKGKQLNYLNTGVYRINTLLFDVSITDITVIGEGRVGIITTLDGQPLSANQIAGDPVDASKTTGHNNFQNFEKFLELGGQRGLQTQYILAGSYTLNPWAVTIEVVDMIEIPIGNVGIVISYVGEDGVDVTGSNFKHGNIVKKGQKGVWETPLDPGKYPINPYTTKIQVVPTTNLVLNWATGRNEAHNLDKNLSTITVRSKDGFPFNLDVSQIIHIPSIEAPKVIARFGSVQNLVSQVLEPTIGNYFRNSAQDQDVIAFLSTRKERQDAAKERISEVLAEYNVHAVDTLIGDINPPNDLMKTLTDRKIASEEEKTFGVQMAAQKVKQTLESETALANMQGEIVAATQSVQIAQRKADASIKEAEGKSRSIELMAEGQAKATKLNAEADAFKVEKLGTAEALKIEKIGDATAQAYDKAVKAMGSENFSKFKIFEEIGKNNTKIIPDILISGGNENGGNSSLAGLATIEMLEYVKGKRQNGVGGNYDGNSETTPTKKS